MATLSVTVGNDAAIRTALRGKVGFPNDSVLTPDETVNGAMRDALAAVNTHRPAVAVSSFETISGHQSYSPLPANAYGFRNVYWSRNGSCADQLSGLRGELLALSEPYNAEGGAGMPDAGAILALQRSAAWLRKLSGGGVQIVGSTVYLDPVPTSSGAAVIFTYHAPRYASVGAIEELDAASFWAKAEALLHRALAAGAGGMKSVRDLAEGTQIEMSPEHHLDLAKARELDFKRMKQPAAPGAFP